MRFYLFFAFAIALFPLSTHAELFDYDVAATVGSISFVPAEIRAGEPTRIYGSIVNVGKKDVSGYVGFYQGVILIGNPQPFSLKSNGVPEEFWVDWTPQEGTYNIMMTVIETTPADQNPANNVALTRMLTVTKPPPPVPVVPPPPPPPVVEKPIVQAPIKEENTEQKKPGPLPKAKQIETLVKPAEKVSVQKQADSLPQVSLKHFVLPPVGKQTSAEATSTATSSPFAATLSNEFIKSVGVFQPENETTTSSIIQEPKLFKEEERPKERSTYGPILVAGITTVILFLIGLLFLKKSRAD